jgi:hypothetical protein
VDLDLSKKENIILAICFINRLDCALGTVEQIDFENNEINWFLSITESEDHIEHVATILKECEPMINAIVRAQSDLSPNSERFIDMQILKHALKKKISDLVRSISR